jgi:hypothetical protein
MAAKLTAGDLMRKLEADVRASQARKFAVLNKPPNIKRPDDMSMADFALQGHWKLLHEHRRKMLRLLFERYGFAPTGKITERRLLDLLGAMLPHYLPAFRNVAVVVGARGRGRPRSGITDRQKVSIDRAVAAGKSVRETCLRLSKQDVRVADALAAAYRRATKV